MPEIGIITFCFRCIVFWKLKMIFPKHFFKFEFETKKFIVFKQNGK